MAKMIKAINNAVGIEISGMANGMLTVKAIFAKDITTERKISIAELKRFVEEKGKCIAFYQGENGEQLRIWTEPSKRILTIKDEMVSMLFEPPMKGSDLVVVEKDDFINAIRSLIK